MRHKKLRLVLAPAFASLFLLGWRSGPDNWIEFVRQQLDKYHTFYLQEKVYVHLDKPYYTLGEELWFKVYLVDGRTHLPEELSNLVYVDLIGPGDSLLARRHIRIEGGGGAGDFRLEPDWPAGKYLLRAYTNFMRNFDEAFLFQQAVFVWEVYPEDPAETGSAAPFSGLNAVTGGEDFDVQFFPEGGELVEGLSSVVGVKATDVAGQGIFFRGKCTMTRAS